MVRVDSEFLFVVVMIAAATWALVLLGTCVAIVHREPFISTARVAISLFLLLCAGAGFLTAVGPFDASSTSCGSPMSKSLLFGPVPSPVAPVRECQSTGRLLAGGGTLVFIAGLIAPAVVIRRVPRRLDPQLPSIPTTREITTAQLTGARDGLPAYRTVPAKQTSARS